MPSSTIPWKDPKRKYQEYPKDQERLNFYIFIISKTKIALSLTPLAMDSHGWTKKEDNYGSASQSNTWRCLHDWVRYLFASISNMDLNSMIFSFCKDAKGITSMFRSFWPKLIKLVPVSIFIKSRPLWKESRDWNWKKLIKESLPSAARPSSAWMLCGWD